MEITDIFRFVLLVTPIPLSIIASIISYSGTPDMNNLIIILSVLYISSLVQKILTLIKIDLTGVGEKILSIVIFISMIPLMLMLWLMYLRRDIHFVKETDCSFDKWFFAFFICYVVEATALILSFFFKQVRIAALIIMITTTILQIASYFFVRQGVEKLVGDCFTG